jgi:formylglycine-generating enzyme required for sulfatase activity
VPQGYLSYFMAKRACENAGKRLCSEREWSLACRGQAGTRFPYGRSFDRPACNVSHGLHPAHVLHGVSSIGHTDPRLNLVYLDGERPLLASTGSSEVCASRWGQDRIYDMVGNVDEWVEARVPTFRGGFYARGTSKGCDAQVTNHAASYYDYSIGARCCRDAE